MACIMTGCVASFCLMWLINTYICLQPQVPFHLSPPIARSAHALYFIHAFDRVHLGGICDVRFLGSKYDVHLVHLGVPRRDAIPIHPTFSGSSLALLSFGRGSAPLRSLWCRRRVRGGTGFAREASG